MHRYNAWLAQFAAAATPLTHLSPFFAAALLAQVQRPRPSWYSQGGGLAAPRAWERDLSFPSAHTQFFSGIAFCACGLCQLPLGAAAAFGLITGLTRNYLGVHWCTDTLAGLTLGAGAGLLWGSLDPYARLARAGSPLLALSSATAASGGMLALLLAIRRLVPARPLAVRRFWLGNALAAFEQPEGVDGGMRDGEPSVNSSVEPLISRQLVDQPAAAAVQPPAIGDDINSLFKQRSLTSKLPQLTTTW